MSLRPTDDRIELTASRLVEAFKAHGQQHTQRVFSALLSEYRLKDWEARAVRARFQALLAPTTPDMKPAPDSNTR